MKYRSSNAASFFSNPTLAVGAAVAASQFLFAGHALAQDALAEEPAPESGVVDLEDEDDALDTPDESASPDETIAAEEAPADEEERKPDGSVQLLMGARYRALIVPKFLINMFGVDGGRTVFENGIGGEIGGYFGKQGNGFMLMGGVWYQNYGMKPTPFKGKNDGDDAWEIIESNGGMVYLALDTMWDYRLIDRLSLLVGGGFGLGIITGSLNRTEAALAGGGAADLPADKDWPALNYCAGPNNPDPVQCPSDGNYGKFKELWPVYPWLNFQLGLKYQPVDEFVGRLEMGVGSTGFWFGLGGDYALFL